MKNNTVISICTISIALTACSSKPDESHIKKFLDEKYQTCNNIEIRNIRKNDGYLKKSDDLYYVNFQYSLYFKDKNKMPEFLEQWKSERLIFNEYQEAKKKDDAYQDFFNNGEKSIAWQKKNPMPKRSDFTQHTQDANEKLIADDQKYRKARDAWDSKWVSEFRDEYDDYLNISKTYRELTEKYRNLTLFGKEVEFISNFYYKGCDSSAAQFTTNWLKPQIEEYQKENDISIILSNFEYNRSADLVFRKTEKGWKPALDEMVIDMFKNFPGILK